jgi:CDGSH-type Zn-finger protein
MSDLEIKARENGPYKISGHFSYIDAAGQKQTTPGEDIALCWCGYSLKKPFCDGTHRQHGFTAPVFTVEKLLGLVKI